MGGVQEPLGGHRGCSLGRSRCSSPQVRPSGPSFRQCTSGRNAGWVGASGDPSGDRGPWVSRAPPARHPRVSALPGTQPSPTHSLGHPHCPGLEPLCSALPPSTPPSSTSWSSRELGQLGKSPRSAASRGEPVHAYWGRGWGPRQSARLLSPRAPGRVSCGPGCGQHRTFASPGLSFPSVPGGQVRRQPVGWL